MGPTWDRQDPGGPHVGPMNLAIWECKKDTRKHNKSVHIFPGQLIYAHLERVRTVYMGNERTTYLNQLKNYSGGEDKNKTNWNT